MCITKSPISLTRHQVAELNDKLAEMRHNINNSLGLISAAAEVLSRKPEAALRVVSHFLEQPQKIVGEIKEFSEAFEKMLQVERRPK